MPLLELPSIDTGGPRGPPKKGNKRGGGGGDGDDDGGGFYFWEGQGSRSLLVAMFVMGLVQVRAAFSCGRPSLGPQHSSLLAPQHTHSALPFRNARTSLALPSRQLALVTVALGHLCKMLHRGATELLASAGAICAPPDTLPSSESPTSPPGPAQAAPPGSPPPFLPGSALAPVPHVSLIGSILFMGLSPSLDAATPRVGDPSPALAMRGGPLAAPACPSGHLLASGLGFSPEAGWAAAGGARGGDWAGGRPPPDQQLPPDPSAVASTSESGAGSQATGWAAASTSESAPIAIATPSSSAAFFALPSAPVLMPPIPEPLQALFTEGQSRLKGVSPLVVAGGAGALSLLRNEAAREAARKLILSVLLRTPF